MIPSKGLTESGDSGYDNGEPADRSAPARQRKDFRKFRPDIHGLKFEQAKPRTEFDNFAIGVESQAGALLGRCRFSGTIHILDQRLQDHPCGPSSESLFSMVNGANTRCRSCHLPHSHPTRFYQSPNFVHKVPCQRFQLVSINQDHLGIIRHGVFQETKRGRHDRKIETMQ